ncbi:class I SAM-dependent methyltransferase [Caldithrix abyssi]|uniref:Methyltransferase domain-containing protein n=1 Tax=Caldithrix abyssi DSM 13497 TaxID=880073 RepID=H1XQ79_CALAY|nr:class I SAM-dependent methyltransferase [Caldithrix abyssi]APF19497.1 Methyltransferase domain-containing protein [Caldithrix abyssi DSM 13497]EHO43384.1 Methyltransferase type 11 [Caldithrix abyssi DSM 13497]
MSISGFKENWFKNWFGEEYIEVYAHRDEQDAQDLIRLIVKNIHITKQTKILDAACGPGRHACLLKNWSDFVFGLDLSMSLLKRARQNCPLELVRGDIRALPFKTRFEVVVSLFTSFGYFFDDGENLQVLKEYHRVLKKGGVFFLDFLNASYVQKHLKGETVRTINGKKIVETRRIVGKRVEKAITIEQKGRQREFLESVRLYNLFELKALLNAAGFKIQKVFGDYQGRPFEAQSPRLIFLTVKKARQ